MLGYSQPKLLVSSLRLTDPEEIKLAQVIAEETEAERERHREEQAARVPRTPTLNRMVSLLNPEGYIYDYSDSLRWEELLTLGNCTFRCAERANMRVIDLLAFADERCQPEGWVLFWYRQWLKTVEEQLEADDEAKIRAQMLEEAQAREKRIREGASIGGKKGAETRRKLSSIPDQATLLKEREKLIANGTPERAANGKLARRYAVTRDAISKKLRLPFKR